MGAPREAWGVRSLERSAVKTGMIGLGEMGAAFVRRLHLAKREVVGYNRTKAKAEPLIKEGMQFAATPREVVEQCEIICCMVTDDKAISAVTDGPDGALAALRPGKVFVEMSTISPAHERELGERVLKTGASFLDAPVSGSQLTVEQGKLLIMVGGDEAAFKKAEPVLLDIGPKVRLIGTIGQAKVMKIALNLQLAVQMLAMSEGLLLAEKSGIPRALAYEMIASSALASPMIGYRGGFAVKMPDKAWFDVNMQQKDMKLALELGRQVEVPLPTTAVANEMLTAARGMGFGDYDFAVLFHTLARMAGLDEHPAPPKA
jgi:3-hydroxyisobutyrate dehydrogenase-like beta-hydroxyacid dehydrogenase